MNLDKEKFTADMQNRIRMLLEIRGISARKAAIDAGEGPTSIKDFLNNKKKTTSLTTFLAWARALDVPYSVLIEGAGYSDAPDFNPYDETRIVDESQADERALRIRSAQNMKFLRGVFNADHEDVAKLCRVFVKGKPDTDLVLAWETGRKMIPAPTADRLAKAWDISIDKIYG